MKNSTELEKMASLTIAGLMAAAARTAPKGRGIDNIEVVAIDDHADLKKLIMKMRKIALAEDKPSLARDAGNIEKSPVIIVIGVKDNPAGLNCGYCGFKTCAQLKKAGAICAFNSIDLGIATLSAAEVAAKHHADNRLMYSIGRAAMDLGWFSRDVRQALGVPLSITGKSPFFDRK